jgi:hypothetical protein
VRQDLAEAWENAGKMGFASRKPPGLDVIEPAIGESEKVISILKGWKGGSQPCSLVLTDQKLYFFSYFAIKYISNTETIPFGTITGIELKQNLVLLGLEVKLTRANNTDTITNVDKNAAPAFVKALQDTLASRTNQTGNKINQNQATDPLDQIKKLKDLLDAGIITEAEFQDKKKELMGKI